MAVNDPGLDIVPNDELLRDIELTKREANAYRKLSEGYRTLESLPENQNQPISRMMKSSYYAGKEEECAKFLEGLIELAKKRGIYETLDQKVERRR
jgi:hypothetical protein